MTKTEIKKKKASQTSNWILPDTDISLDFQLYKTKCPYSFICFYQGIPYN